MKFQFVLLMSLLSALISCATLADSSSDPAVVTSIDLNRYSGTWYEVAHSPNFFQGSCAHSTAEYAVLSATSISVHNTCYKADGSSSDIKGTATIPDPNVPAKLRVRFNFFARGDYWVTALDPNYQWALVSGPGKSSIFILSRTAPIAADLENDILANMRNEGYDVDHLIFDKY